MRLEQRIICLLAAGVCLSSCATTSIETRRDAQKDQMQIQPQVISHSSITISEPTEDSVIDQANEILEYLHFQDAYAGKISGILASLGEDQNETIEEKIKVLGVSLKKDQNKYAQQLFTRIKEFNYTVYEVYETDKTKTTKKVSKPMAGAAVIMTPVCLFYDAFALPVELYSEVKGLITGKRLRSDIYFDDYGVFNGEMRLFYCTMSWWSHFLEKRSTIERKDLHFNKVTVWPYTGKRDLIEEKVPFARLEQVMSRVK